MRTTKLFSILALMLLILYNISPVLSEETGKAVKITKNIEKDSDDSDLKETTSKYNAKTSNGKEYLKTGWLTDIDQITKKKTGTDEPNSLTKKPIEDDESISDDDPDDLKEKGEDDEEENLGLTDQLAIAVCDGIFFALGKLADEGFNAGIDKESNPDVLDVAENNGMVVGLIYLIATIEWDPSTVDFILDMQVKSWLFGMFLIIVFVFLGAFNVNIYAMTSKKHRRTAHILANRYHLPINEYMITIAEALLLTSFGFLILRVVLWIELILSKLIMIPILDRIAPTGENTLMYLLFFFLYIGAGIALAIRLIIIGIVHGGFMIGVGMRCYGFTRDLVKKIFYYYVKVVFLRSAIILITVVGVGIITSIQNDGIENPLMGVFTGYAKLLFAPLLTAGMLILIIAVSWSILFEIKDVIRASRYVRSSYNVYRTSRSYARRYM